MRKLLLLLLLACIASPVLAQYNGPAVEACRDYARKELAREGGKGEVVFERDGALVLDRYTRKVGAQFVSSVLMGNGALVLDGSPSSELSFICLLADDKRPVFFSWLPRSGDYAPMVQCLRHDSLRAKPRQCLDLLQRIAEQDLTIIYAQRFQEANERGEKSVAAYRRANDEWKEYVSAECDRRRDLAPKGVSPDDARVACVADLTRRRALDMR